MRSLAGLAVLSALAAGPALAEACRVPAAPARGEAAKRAACPPEERLAPYDPDRARAGRSPGFIDLGNGTEVRIGGRARMDYDTRR